MRPRRPEGPDFKSPPESNLYRLNHQACATTQLGTTEESRTNARSDPTRRRERGPPNDRVEDRRATTARPLEAGHEDGVSGKRLHLWRKGHAEGPRLRGPDRAASRRSDARPQAMAPRPAPPLLDTGTDLRHGAKSVVPGLVRSTSPASLRQGGIRSRIPRSDAASCGVVMASVDACPWAGCTVILPREAVSVRA